MDLRNPSNPRLNLKIMDHGSFECYGWLIVAHNSPLEGTLEIICKRSYRLEMRLPTLYCRIKWNLTCLKYTNVGKKAESTNEIEIPRVQMEVGCGTGEVRKGGVRAVRNEPYKNNYLYKFDEFFNHPNFHIVIVSLFNLRNSSSICVSIGFLSEMRKSENFFFLPFNFALSVMSDEEGESRRKVRYTLEQVEDLLELNSVIDTVERFIQPEHGKVLKVVLIEKVTNPVLEERYMVRQGEMVGYSASTTKLKFHGTSSRALHKILNNGFRIPENPGMYGRGVYFATDSSKSAQYSVDQTKLLLCEVALGKAMVVSSADHALDFDRVTALGYDSVYAPRGTKSTAGVLFDEFVVYHRDQAIPRYCVTYTEDRMPGFDESAVPYSDEPLVQESLPQGPVRWKKSLKSSKWSERYAYILHGRFVSLFKSASQCKSAVAAIHADRKPSHDPEIQVDILALDSIDVKEENDIKILVLKLHDGSVEYLAIEDAYEWMRVILKLKMQLKTFAQAVLDTADKDSDDEDSGSSMASSSAASSPSMSEFEARKAARKAKVGMRVDVRQQNARAAKDKVAIYDEVSGHFMGQLANDELHKNLPREKTKLALHIGPLALKTEKSWKVLLCVIEGSYLVAYKRTSGLSDDGSGGKKPTYEEHKRIGLDFAKVIRSSFTFGKRTVPAFMIVADKKPYLFTGKGIPEWIDMLKRFAGEGTRELESQPLVSEKEAKRWKEKSRE